MFRTLHIAQHTQSIGRYEGYGSADHLWVLGELFKFSAINSVIRSLECSHQSCHACSSNNFSVQEHCCRVSYKLHRNHIINSFSSQQYHTNVQKSNVFERPCGIGNEGASIKHNVIEVVTLGRKRDYTLFLTRSGWA